MASVIKTDFFTGGSGHAPTGSDFHPPLAQALRDVRREAVEPWTAEGWTPIHCPQKLAHALQIVHCVMDQILYVTRCT